jgi:hypothetical protein
VAVVVVDDGVAVVEAAAVAADTIVPDQLDQHEKARDPAFGSRAFYICPPRSVVALRPAHAKEQQTHEQRTHADHRERR